MNFPSHFWEVGGFILDIASIFLFMDLKPFCVIQQNKYHSSVCPKKYFLVVNLSPFSLNLFSVSYHFCTRSIQSTFVKVKISCMYTHRNLNP